MAQPLVVTRQSPLSLRLQEESALQAQDRLEAEALQSQGYDIAPMPVAAPVVPQQPLKPEGLGDELYNSLAKGFHGLYNNTGRAFSQLAEPFAPEFAKRRIAESLQDDVNYARQHPSTFTNWDQVDKTSPMQIARYGLSAFGESVPSTLGAVVGGVVGKKLAPLTKLSPYAGTVAGGTAAMAAPEMGEQVATLHNDPYVMENSTPWGRVANTAGKGLINAYIETMTEARMLNPVGKIGKGFLEGAKHVAKTTALAAPSEGMEEYLQDRVGQTAHGMLNPNKEYNPAQGKEAFIRGAFGGGGLGVVGGTGQVLASKFMPNGDFDHSDKIPDHIRKRSLDDQARYLEDTDFKNELNAAHRVQSALNDPDLTPSHRKNLEDALTNVHTREGQIKAAVLVESGEIGKSAAKIAKKAAARFGKMFEHPEQASAMDDFQPFDESTPKVRTELSPTQQYSTHRYADDVLRQDAASDGLREMGEKLNISFSDSDIENIANAISFANSKQGSSDPSVSKELTNTFSELRSQLNEDQRAKLDKFTSSFNITTGLGTHDIIKAALEEHGASPEFAASRAARVGISDHFTQANNQKNTLAKMMTGEGTTKRMQKLQALFGDETTPESVRKEVGDAIAEEQLSISNHFETPEFQETQAALIKQLGAEGYNDLAGRINDHWKQLDSGHQNSYSEDIEDTDHSDELDHDELVGSQYASNTDDILAAMDDVKAELAKLGMKEDQKLYKGILERSMRKRQEKINLRSAQMMQDPTIIGDEYADDPDRNVSEFDEVDFNLAMLEKGITPEDREVVQKAISQVKNNEGTLELQKSNRSGNAVTRFFGVKKEKKEYTDLEKMILQHYRATKAESKDIKKAYHDSLEYARSLTKDKYVYKIDNQERVAEVFKKYGANLNTLLEEGKRREMSKRASTVNQPHEFTEEDLKYLTMDEGEEKTKDGLDSLFLIRMVDKDGDEILINAHNVTSMMAVGNVEASQENEGLPYKAQVARNFMSGWAALTELGLTPVNAQLNYDNTNWRTTTIFKEGRKLVDLTPEQLGEYQKSGKLPAKVRAVTKTLYYPGKMEGKQVPSRGLTGEELDAHIKTGELPEGVTWVIHPTTNIKNVKNDSPVQAIEINKYAGNYFGKEREDRDTIISNLETEVDELQDKIDNEQLGPLELQHIIRTLEDKLIDLDIQRGYALEAMMNDQGPSSDIDADGALDYMIEQFLETPMVGMDGRINPNWFGGRTNSKGKVRYVAKGPSAISGIEPDVPAGQTTSAVPHPFSKQDEGLDALGKSLKKTIHEYATSLKLDLSPGLGKLPLAAKGMSAMNLQGAILDLLKAIEAGNTSAQPIKKYVLLEAKRAFYLKDPKQVAAKTYELAKKIREITEQLRADLVVRVAPVEEQVPPFEEQTPAGGPLSFEEQVNAYVYTKEHNAGLKIANSLLNIWKDKLGMQLEYLDTQYYPERPSVRGVHIPTSDEDGNRSSGMWMDPELLLEKNRGLMLATLSHEFGHAIEWQMLGKASQEVQDKLKAAYERALAEQKANPNMSFAQHAASWRSPYIQSATVDGDVPFKEKSATIDARQRNHRTDITDEEYAAKYPHGYTLAYDEWLAEQFARYVHQDEFRDSLPEDVRSFFGDIVKAIKAFFKYVGGTNIGVNYDVAEEYKSFIATLGAEQASVPDGTETDFGSIETEAEAETEAEIPAHATEEIPTEEAEQLEMEEAAAENPAPESDPKILAYLQKLLGKNVELYLKDYADVAGKYAYDKERGMHIITLSKLAGFEGVGTKHEELKGLFSYLMGQSYESTAAHEAAHGMYRDMKGTKVYAALSKYALQPHVMAQLKVLLKDSPQALEEARTNMEARLAYVFQFVETGQFLIKQPEVNNWFNRMRAFVRGLFHVLTSDEKAARIFTAMHQGKFANNPKKMYSKLGLLSTIERIEKHSPLLRDINDALFKGFNAQHTRAINSGSLVLKNAADRFWLAPAQRGEIGADFPANTPDFLHARTQTMNRYMNELVDITDGWGKKELEEQIKKIRRGETPANEREAKLHSEMKTFFKTLFDYMEDSGVKRAVFDKDTGKMTWEDMKARKDYRMPQVWDPKKIAEDTAGFIEFAKKTGMSEEAAAGMAERLKKNQFGIDEVQQSLFDVTITPAMTSLNERQIEITPALQDEAEKFLKTDMIEVVSSYVRQAVHRAEFTYRFGNDGEEITKIIDDAKKEGIAKKEDIDQFRLLVKATEGTIGHDISDQMKAINGNMIAYQNWRVLGLSLFTSQIDPLGISVRTGKLADAWKAFTIGWASIFGQLKNQQAYELAARIGIIDQSNTFEGIGNVYSSQYVTGWAKKANDVLFKINGMDAWNNGMRVAATQIGAQWILDNKDNPEILANLGIDASTVDWDLALEKDLTDFFDQEQIANGLFRFVDETILRPNAAQRPAWGSDPHFALVWHLKQFTFTFTEVIIKSALQQAKNGNMTPLYMLASYVPFMMAADFARGLVQGGGEEPEWKKRMSFMDRIQSAIMRSGVSGPYVFAEDAAADSGMGKIPGISFLGPTVNQAVDVTSGLGKLGDNGDPNTPDRTSTFDKLGNIFESMLPLNNIYKHWDDEGKA